MMNQRLNTLYANIEISNYNKFLRNEVEIDPMIGKSIHGTTLQIELSEKVKNIICAFQEKLVRLEPEALFVTPRLNQHISFNQVVFWNGKYTLGVSETWKQIETKFVKNFQELNYVFNAFPITFSKLIATTGAIIWCAFDENDELETLRNDFYHRLPFPEERCKSNHFIHTSVVRFQKKLSNPQRILELVRDFSQKATMKVKDIVLLKECRYPSLNTQEVARISLR